MKSALRKLGGALASVAAAIAVTTSAHAYTFNSAVTSTASVTVGGGSVAMSVVIRNVSNNNEVSEIAWTANAGGPWTQAEQYLQIASTLSVAGSGIQTYTDNKNAANARPLYTGSTMTASGLVNTADTTATLPTAWQIVPEGATPLVADNPDCNGTAGQPASCTGTGHTGYAWFYHKDKAHQDFANAFFYIVMEKAGVPPSIQFAQNSFGAGASSGINNVYLEANFQSALAGNTYQTSTLTVELFNP
jgi:hypothetical protein